MAVPPNETKDGFLSVSGIADALLKIAAFFIILEPVWMLLPFAGFLYGSVMHIETLSSNTATSWLVYFVLPTHTLFPAGIILVASGFAIFLVGAFQIYSAKLLKKGLVKNGIYKFFRHPQYVALSVFCVGIILTWGRFITYIAFFIMLWLYYYLSKSEERKCESAFGPEYEEYKKSTYFLFPGENILFRMWAGVPDSKVPSYVFIPVSFIFVVCFAIISGFFIQWIRMESRQSIPCMQTAVSLPGTDAFDLVMVKGPAMQAAPFEDVKDEFMGKQFNAIKSSGKITEFLKPLSLDGDSTVLMFLTPGNNWHERMGRHDSDRVDLFILVLKTPVKYDGKNFSEFRRSWGIRKVARAYDFSVQAYKEGRDPAEGEIKMSSPPFGAIPETQRFKIEERVDFFLSGL